MLQRPTKSVTRFFIPMLDVMILLFSMFLLLPIAEQAGEYEGVAQDIARLQKQKLKLAQDNLIRSQQLDRQLDEYEKLKEELETLRQQKFEDLVRFIDIRPLTIEPTQGKLIYADRRSEPPKRIVLETEEQAKALIAKHKSQGKPGQKLYYFFLYPDPDTGSPFPEAGQVRKYFDWFSEVPTGVDGQASTAN